MKKVIRLFFGVLFDLIVLFIVGYAVFTFLKGFGAV